jgi:hypothetical protein
MALNRNSFIQSLRYKNLGFEKRAADGRDGKQSELVHVAVHKLVMYAAI